MQDNIILQWEISLKVPVTENTPILYRKEGEIQMPVNSFENYPMSWKPVLDKTSNVPIYIYLSDLLKQDILSGKLTPGTKLPPQRELADYLDIHLSTVTRAFKLCEQRGLICSVMGSGTFVSSDAATQGMLIIHDSQEKIIEMGPILPNPDISQIATDYLKHMSKEPDFYKLLQYAPTNYDELQIKAAKRWLSYLKMQSSRQNILFSAGSQNGIFATLASLFKEGDRIATTQVTYPGLKAAAKILGIQVIPMPLYEGKLTRESLEYVAKNHNIKGLYLIPDFNNPSGEQLDLASRKMIASFCNEKRIPFIEDGIYTLFQPEPLPPISQFSSEYGIFIASVSKIMSPGLRLAVLHVPRQFYEAVSMTLYAMEITPPALMMQLFTRLVNSGKFDRIREQRIAELVERNRIFDEICNKCSSNGDTYSPIRWVKLRDDDTRTPAQFEKEMKERGVQLYAAERFVVGNTEIPRAVRVSLISEHKLTEYKRGLRLLQESY